MSEKEEHWVREREREWDLEDFFSLYEAQNSQGFESM